MLSCEHVIGRILRFRLLAVETANGGDMVMWFEKVERSARDCEVVLAGRSSEICGTVGEGVGFSAEHGGVGISPRAGPNPSPADVK